MNLLKYLTVMGVSIVFIGAFTTAQATSTDVVLNLEGNPTCSSLGDNSLVQVFKDSSPGGTRELTLPLPNGGGTQKVSYTVEKNNAGIDQITTWNIFEVNGNPVNGTEEQQDLFYAQVNALNYIILKAQGGNNGARVFHYGTSDDGPGSPGAITDQVLVSPGPKLAAVSFCYGLTTGTLEPADPPIVLTDLEDCEELDTNGDDTADLYTTGIDCPAPIVVDGRVTNEQLIINMALNDPRFGFDLATDTIRACTCNSNLKPCNPALPAQLVTLVTNSAGEEVAAYVNDAGDYVDQDGDVIDDGVTNFITADDLSQEDRTCLEYNPDSTSNSGIPDGVNERVPFHIEGVENPDSYVCYTFDGVRTCYGHY